MAAALKEVADSQVASSKVADDASAKVAQNETLFSEEIYDLSTSISNVGNTISEMNAGLKSILTVNKDASGNYHPTLKAESYSLMDTSGGSRSFAKLLDDASSDVVFSSRSGNTTDSLARVWVGDVVFSNTEGNTALGRITSLESSTAKLEADVSTRALDVSLRQTNAKLAATDSSVEAIYDIALAANASLNEIYDPDQKQVSAIKFRVGSGAM